MFANVGEGHEFTCPWCGQGLEIQSWDTEYGDLLVGSNTVDCTRCHKEINIHVYVETVIEVNSIKGQSGYEESWAAKNGG